MSLSALRRLAEAIDPQRAEAVRARAEALVGSDAVPVALAVVTAFPPFAGLLERDPAAFEALAAEGWRTARDRSTYVRHFVQAIDDFGDEEGTRRGLRAQAAREMLRIALRELAPPNVDGAEVEATARETADLAEAALEVALAEAEVAARSRFGIPRRADGQPSHVAIVGLGKLGGRELNVGSDVDILFIYDTDEGSAGSRTLHEYWSWVVRRVTATLDGEGAGHVFRVDLRLRPEGASGPLANSVESAEHYYENFGRPWERAALVRARTVAGDRELGAAFLSELEPFIFPRRVDPSIAIELGRLLERGRAEGGPDIDRNLKLGRGGIREAEFFVQALQLIWGGREPSVRVVGTLDALGRLRARGLVSDREAREVESAYVLLRAIEHRVQWSTGQQTHALPSDAALLGRLARSAGYRRSEDLARDVTRARTRVAARFASLAPVTVGTTTDAVLGVLDRLSAGDEAGAAGLLEAFVAGGSAPDVARSLRALGRRPDDPLGPRTAARHPGFSRAFVAALLDAADPELAARNLHRMFARMAAPSLYVGTLAADDRALTRLATVCGASAFVGSVIAEHPAVRDEALLAPWVPSPASAGAEIAEAAREAATADVEDFVGELRAAKLRMTVATALAELGGELSLREALAVLSAIAEATLEATIAFAAREIGAPEQGMAVIALGKLGGAEIGYGADLDVLFVYEAPSDGEWHARYTKLAQRVLRLVAAPHARGPGYELDTRLRPSGEQGALVVSLSSFTRYHGLDALAPSAPAARSSAPWERQALVRARHAAGDVAVGARASALAGRAAYELGAPPAAELHRLRLRMQQELGRERPGRYNLKVGQGGLVDIEFAAQFLQMRFGHDVRVRTPSSPAALDALETCGYLTARDAEALVEGYTFLRTLEQRIRIVHGSGAPLLDENAGGLAALARRMGLRDGPHGSAERILLERYRATTERVRAAYEAVLGIA